MYPLTRHHFDGWKALVGRILCPLLVFPKPNSPDPRGGSLDEYPPEVLSIATRSLPPALRDYFLNRIMFTLSSIAQWNYDFRAAPSMFILCICSFIFSMQKVLVVTTKAKDLNGRSPGLPYVPARD